MPSMTGTFKLIKSENFEEYLMAIGVNFLMREKIIPASSTTHITNVAGEWAITTFKTFNKTIEIKFKLGQEFDETTADGRSCQSVIIQEGQNKLVHVQNYDTGLTSTIVREFSETEMKMTLEGPGKVVSTRIYQRK